MELHRFFRYAIEKMCKEKKSLNHFYFHFYMMKIIYWLFLSNSSITFNRYWPYWFFSIG